MERKLAAILAADVAGYSRLMGVDEEGTHSALRAHREVVDRLIVAHRGRVFGSAGDSVIAEFPSAVEAINCAVGIQTEMSKRNEPVPKEKRLQFRIGLNIGDVMAEGGNLFGDGVNIASRVQELAAPGGICAARNVYNQVRQKVGFAFESHGEHRVKNIAEPISVYRVLIDGEAKRPPIFAMLVLLRRQRRVVAAGAAILLVTVGSLVWNNYLRLPDKPSIAVLPFTSDDSEQEYFADGMTEDLITDLSKLSGIFVIARNSTGPYKGKPTKLQQVAEELGIQFVLQGSIRRDGDQVRINAQLIDVLSSQQLWAERYDGSAGEVFALQDKVIGQIVSALSIKLTREESIQIAVAETKVPQAYDALLQGWDHYRRETPEETTKAITQFEKALELDPEYSRAYAGLAATYWRLVGLEWEFAISSEWQHAFEQMNKNLARALEKPTSVAYTVSAELLAREGRYDEALGQIELAMDLGPNEPSNFISRARVLNATGQAEQAEEAVRVAMRLNPHYPPDYLRVLGQALLHQERYAEAAELLERVVTWQSDITDDYVTLAAAYGQLGRIEHANAAIKKYNDLMAKVEYNALNLQEVRFWWYGDIFDYDEAYRERLLAGLRKAGVPEGSGTEISLADLKRRMSKSAGEYNVEGATKVNAETANALQGRGVVIVDIRDGGSFERGHIPGAAHLDLMIGLSEESLRRLVSDQNEVVFYCWGKYCPLSAYASAKAVIWGFTRVYYFAGGFPAWQDAGYPVDVSLGP